MDNEQKTQDKNIRIITDTGRDDGMNYYFCPTRDNKSDGPRYGYQVETFQIRWRAEKALDALNESDIESASRILNEILREIAIAERQAIPCMYLINDSTE